MAVAQEPCRRAVRERLLGEMLSTVVDPVGAGWKVLVMDATTTRIMSSALRMSDILDAGVSVVEDLDKNREPLNMPAVYFITPSPASVKRLVLDFQKKPLYPSVHIFFSSRVSAEAVDHIKKCALLLPLLKSLKEVNLEFFTIDGRTVVTEQPHAMIRCMGERCESNRADVERELDVTAMRLATLFSTLNDYPAIRYRAGRIPEPGDPPGAATRSTLTQRLAQKVTERLMVMQRSGQLPPRETCDLIILDRSIDPVAPVIHEWTYEPLVYDLLPVEDKAISYTTETASGKQEVKQHVLDEGDELWVELRHSHIADVYTTLAKRFTDFQSKNKAAKYQSSRGDASGMSAGGIKALIQAMPQYREVIGRLSVHIFISSELKNTTNSRQLTDVGELEQDLVYGDRSSQELIKFLADRAGSLNAADKMRLFICYLATHPEKMDATKRSQWQKLARLEPGEMAAICNLAYLNVSVMKQPAVQSKGLSFGLKKKKKSTYRRREGREESNYALSRFDPVLMDVVEDAAANKLSPEEYPWVRPPTDPVDDFGVSEATRIGSVRQNKSATNWARRGPGGTSGDASISSLASALGSMALGGGSVTSGGGGRRLLVFVIGGVTRSEMRVVHTSSRQLNRDILLASTSVLTPKGFLGQLREMGRLED